MKVVREGTRGAADNTDETGGYTSEAPEISFSIPAEEPNGTIPGVTGEEAV